VRGELGEPGQRRDRPVAHQHQRGAHLQLLDVLGQVAAGHALVDVLVTGQRAELLDARLHVVPGHRLAAADRVEVDVVDDLLVGLDDPVRHVDPELALGLEDRDPQPSLEHHLVLRRPDAGQVRAGVAAGEDVGHDRGRHRPIVAGRAGRATFCPAERVVRGVSRARGRATGQEVARGGQEVARGGRKVARGGAS
jgi:hypothetical protein